MIFNLSEKTNNEKKNIFLIKSMLRRKTVTQTQILVTTHWISITRNRIESKEIYYFSMCTAVVLTTRWKANKHHLKRLVNRIKKETLNRLIWHVIGYATSLINNLWGPNWVIYLKIKMILVFDLNSNFNNIFKRKRPRIFKTYICYENYYTTEL